MNVICGVALPTVRAVVRVDGCSAIRRDIHPHFVGLSFEFVTQLLLCERSPTWVVAYPVAALKSAD